MSDTVIYSVSNVQMCCGHNQFPILRDAMFFTVQYSLFSLTCTALPVW